MEARARALGHWSGAPDTKPTTALNDDEKAPGSADNVEELGQLVLSEIITAWEVSKNGSEQSLRSSIGCFIGQCSECKKTESVA